MPSLSLFSYNPKSHELYLKYYIRVVLSKFRVLTHEMFSRYRLIDIVASSIFVGIVGQVEYRWFQCFAPGITRTRISQRIISKLKTRGCRNHSFGIWTALPGLGSRTGGGKCCQARKTIGYDIVPLDGGLGMRLVRGQLVSYSQTSDTRSA
jgi:hypothetical protein